MLFNSYVFIFIFLPATWLGWRAALALKLERAGVAWLCLASLVFYGYSAKRYVPLLILSLLINYALGQRLGDSPPRTNRGLLIVGLIWNLGLLGYFKYFHFFLENVNALTGSQWMMSAVILPLGISFFTFQKIAYLVDAYRGAVKGTRFLDFALFVLFFPQLIAGPIVHHGEFIPQLRDERTWQFDVRRTLLGAAVFVFGLFQKAVVADSLSVLADETFKLSADHVNLRLFEAWTGLVAYALQLLYDFSGYSHMALGLALLFGFKLPINFLAPYTSGSIIAFWRRWHITLSAFLRDYVYIPLGGNRHGFSRQMANLFFTMALAGLWHGAGWTFIIWGMWHGAALCVNHLWRRWHNTPRSPEHSRQSPWWAYVLTAFVVLVGWTVFRAQDLESAALLGRSLIGLHGISVPLSWANAVQSLAPVVRPRGLFPNIGVEPNTLMMLVLALIGACAGPRLLRWIGVTRDDVTSVPRELEPELASDANTFSYGRVAIAAAVFAVAVAALYRSSPFLYFQF